MIEFYLYNQTLFAVIPVGQAQTYEDANVISITTYVTCREYRTDHWKHIQLDTIEHLITNRRIAITHLPTRLQQAAMELILEN